MLEKLKDQFWRWSMAGARSPNCGESFGPESINIAEGVAYCTPCGTLSRLSEVLSRKRTNIEVLARTPAGCSVTDLSDQIILKATLHSLSSLFGALAVALFWNGITSMFVGIAGAGLYSNLVGPLPAWFPAPQNINQMDLKETLFLCCFLVPFVTIGMVMIGAVLLNACGKVEVDFSDETAEVRTGVGYCVWRRRFDPTQFVRISCGTTPWQSNGRHSQLIEIEADRIIKFGSLLQDDRREWLQVMLHELLATRDWGQRHEIMTKVSQSERSG